MFLTSLLLVMTMNFYAVVREPELVPIEDLPEYPMETVKIEGILTSWIRDPYGDGDDRIDMQVMDKNDGYTVAEVRWVKNGYINESNIPAIGFALDHLKWHALQTKWGAFLNLLLRDVMHFQWLEPDYSLDFSLPRGNLLD